MHEQTQQKQPLYVASMSRRAWAGALVGLVIVTLFLIGVGFKGRPEWQAAWFVRPLAVVTFAGAIGGIISAWLDQLAIRKRWSRWALAIPGLLIFIVGMWLSFVLGFAGTYWH